jgi:BlaI family penicillinase repressor
MAGRPPPSEQELEVLKVLWDEGPSTVRGVDEVFRRRGVQRIYTHLQTLLNRLQAKGHVASEPRLGALAHVYRAISTRDELLRDRLRDLADQLCEGATTPLVLTLVEGHQFSDEEIARLRAVLEKQRPRA